MSANLYLTGPVPFTRHTSTSLDPYTAATDTSAGDLIANSPLNTGVVPFEFTASGIDTSSTVTVTGAIVGVQLATGGVHQALVRVHLWHSVAPTVSNGDNERISVSNFSQDKYIGFVDINLTAGPNGGSQGGDDDLFLSYAKLSGAYI